VAGAPGRVGAWGWQQGGNADMRGFTQSGTIPTAMGDPAVAFTVPRLGALLVRELERAGREVDLDDREPSSIPTEDYERLAIRVEERYGADVPDPCRLEPLGQPKTKRRRRRRYVKAPQTARCVFLARALTQVCALERVRAAYQCAEDVMPLYPELHGIYKRRRVCLMAALTRLDALGNTPSHSKMVNDVVASKKAFCADLLRATPLPDESVPTLPTETQAEVSKECWDRVARLLAETGLTQDDLAPILYGDFDGNPKRVKNRLGQKVFRARKRRAH
jgi:hypothetical protein